jgi:hypothetical protein
MGSQIVYSSIVGLRFKKQCPEAYMERPEICRNLIVLYLMLFVVEFSSYHCLGSTDFVGNRDWLYRIMSAALRTARLHQVVTHTRCLATASGSKSAFKATLAAGPSFDEFLSESDQGNDRVVLGNSSGYVGLH